MRGLAGILDTIICEIDTLIGACAPYSFIIYDIFSDSRHRFHRGHNSIIQIYYLIRRAYENSKPKKIKEFFFNFIKEITHEFQLPRASETITSLFEECYEELMGEQKENQI